MLPLSSWALIEKHSSGETVTPVLCSRTGGRGGGGGGRGGGGGQYFTASTVGTNIPLDLSPLSPPTQKKCDTQRSKMGREREGGERERKRESSSDAVELIRCVEEGERGKE